MIGESQSAQANIQFYFKRKYRKCQMMNRFGLWIIRYSTGAMFTYHGFRKDADGIAEQSIRGTDVTFVIV